MVNKMNKLIVATASCAIACAAVNLNSAKAATLEYDFQVYPDSGQLSGETYSGSFRYDDSALTGVGDEYISVDAIDFTFSENNYSLGEFLAAPEVAFLDGEFLGLSGSTDDFSFIAGFFALDEAYFAYEVAQVSGAADVIYNFKTGDTPPKTVPEPGTAIGLGIVGCGLLLTKKKSDRKK